MSDGPPPNAYVGGSPSGRRPYGPGPPAPGRPGCPTSRLSVGPETRTCGSRRVVGDAQLRMHRVIRPGVTRNDSDRRWAGSTRRPSPRRLPGPTVVPAGKRAAARLPASTVAAPSPPLPLGLVSATRTKSGPANPIQVWGSPRPRLRQEIAAGRRRGPCRVAGKPALLPGRAGPGARTWPRTAGGPRGAAQGPCRFRFLSRCALLCVSAFGPGRVLRIAFELADDSKQEQPACPGLACCLKVSVRPPALARSGCADIAKVIEIFFKFEHPVKPRQGGVG